MTKTILTADDETTIRTEYETTARRYHLSFDAEDGGRRVRDTEFEVRRFAETSTYRTAEVTAWRAKVMERLTEGGYRPLNLRGRPVSHEDLVADWEVKTAEYEAEWDGGWEGDEPFRPWEGFEAAQAFLAATPYRVWKVAEKVKDVARDAASDALEMVTGVPYDVAKVMDEAFDKEIARLLKEADQAAEAA